MKFVIGLVAGASATLAIATLAGMDWEPPTRLNENLLAQTSLLPAHEVPNAVTATTESATKKPEAEAVAAELEPEPAPFRSVTIDPLPAEPLPEPAPVIASAPAPAKQPATARKSRLKPDRLDTSVPTSTDVATKNAKTPPKAAQAGAEEVTTAVVWKPFHSEVSATGFARRLSTQLGYPFRALREGPAKYHVVFDYETPQQRELLRQQVQALTGFSVI